MINKKFLGQHFLKNGEVVKKIIDAIDPKKGDVIFEIGPGHGELTIPLAEVCRKNGAKLIAIEKDKELVTALNIEGVEIMEGDALKHFKLKPVAESSYKIVGNIPYYFTGHLLRIISEMGNKPERCVFMIQKEVAERILSAPPKMNRLAASVQFWANPTIISIVPKEDFDPKPEVDSAILSLELKNKSGASTDHYYQTIRMLFAQPRKTVLNNLAVHGDKEKTSALLINVGVMPESRPQNLSIENILAITEAMWG